MEFGDYSQNAVQRIRRSIMRYLFVPVRMQRKRNSYSLLSSKKTFQQSRFFLYKSFYINVVSKHYSLGL